MASGCTVHFWCLMVQNAVQQVAQMGEKNWEHFAKSVAVQTEIPQTDMLKIICSKREKDNKAGIGASSARMVAKAQKRA
jgi:hypothetical protein